MLQIAVRARLENVSERAALDNPTFVPSYNHFNRKEQC